MKTTFNNLEQLTPQTRSQPPKTLNNKFFQSAMQRRLLAIVAWRHSRVRGVHEWVAGVRHLGFCLGLLDLEV